MHCSKLHRTLIEKKINFNFLVFLQLLAFKGTDSQTGGHGRHLRPAQAEEGPRVQVVRLVHQQRGLRHGQTVPQASQGNRRRAGGSVERQ